MKVELDLIEFDKAYARCIWTAREYSFSHKKTKSLIKNLLKLRNDGDMVGNSIKMLLIRLLWNQNKNSPLNN